jgi:hypothetical protein
MIPSFISWFVVAGALGAVLAPVGQAPFTPPPAQGPASSAATRPTQTAPPDRYYRQPTRLSEGATSFPLVTAGKPSFSIYVGPASDEILTTAARDLSLYFGRRWKEAPRIVSNIADSGAHGIVLANLGGIDKLPAGLRRALGRSSRPTALPEQGYEVRRVTLPDGRVFLVCIGGTSIGARYAWLDLLRRMTYDAQTASVGLDRLRDEPYFTWRAIYLNVSNHQFNNYGPNLICNSDTNRWTEEEWKAFIDQIAFMRYNVLQIWIVPQLFDPAALKGGGIFDSFRDTMRAVARYAKPRGVTLSLLNGFNSTVNAGTRLDTLFFHRGNMPVYSYLSPNKPQERQLMLDLWDYWSRTIPEVGIWTLFPGDPGGCHEPNCGPETNVELAIEIASIIKRNNPAAIVDYTPWQFFGWGETWPSMMRRDTARVDRGFDYLMKNLHRFPRDTIFGPNLNEFTSEPPLKGGGYGGGSAVKYLTEMARSHPVHTWSYSVTEGEGWINHHYKVPDILKQRDVEARFPISGGICYTMTPKLNYLNQFACAEGFWDPASSVGGVMERYTEGVFGTRDAKVAGIFPSFNVAPTTGYTFDNRKWRPDTKQLLADMRRNRQMLESLHAGDFARFELMARPSDYVKELVYFTDLYSQLAELADKVDKARSLAKAHVAFFDVDASTICAADARLAAEELVGPQREALLQALKAVDAEQLAALKRAYQKKHYQIFADCPSEFTPLLPLLIDGFFEAFGGDFFECKRSGK